MSTKAKIKDALFPPQNRKLTLKIPPPPPSAVRLSFFFKCQPVPVCRSGPTEWGMSAIPYLEMLMGGICGNRKRTVMESMNPPMRPTDRPLHSNRRILPEKVNRVMTLNTQTG